MRVVHVVAAADPTYAYGGPLTVAVAQCRALRAEGHVADLAAGWIGTGRPGPVFDGVTAHLFPSHDLVPPLRWSGRLAPGLLGWLWRHARGYDAVQVHLGRELTPLLACAVADRRGVPYLTMTHGMVVPDARRVAVAVDALGTRRALHGAAVQLVLTAAEDDALTAVAGPHPDRVRVDQVVEVPGPPPGDAGGSPASDPEVLFLARLHPRKRPLAFVAAARALLDRGVRARFTLAGPDDGAGAAVRAELARDPRDGIAWVGAVTHDEALARLGAAAVYVLPSADEPMPMTVLEAAARGTPTVCTASCGLAPALRDRGAGVVVPDDDVDALVAAVGALLDDPAARAAAGAAARALAAERYGPAPVARTLLAAYARATATATATATRRADGGGPPADVSAGPGAG